MNGEIRPFLPRRASAFAVLAATAAAMASPAAARAEESDAIVGGLGILQTAQDQAGECLPPRLRDRRQGQCDVPDGSCAKLPIRRQSFTTAANSTAGTITFSFQQSFQLNKLSITASAADGVTISSLKIAGKELLTDGPMNGGPFSTSTLEAGAEVGDGSWCDPGQNITLTYAQAAAATTYTIAGIGA